MHTSAQSKPHEFQWLDVFSKPIGASHQGPVQPSHPHMGHSTYHPLASGRRKIIGKHRCLKWTVVCFLLPNPPKTSPSHLSLPGLFGDRRRPRRHRWRWARWTSRTWLYWTTRRLCQPLPVRDLIRVPRSPWGWYVRVFPSPPAASFSVPGLLRLLGWSFRCCDDYSFSIWLSDIWYKVAEIGVEAWGYCGFYSRVLEQWWGSFIPW